MIDIKEIYDYLDYANEKTKLDLSPFSNIVKKRFDNFNYKEKDICLFSTFIPKELVEAYGFNPVYILGGTLNFEERYDDLFPRDVDKVVHSSYLYFKEYIKSYDREPIAVVALLNDSYRKLAELLKDEGVKVIAVDLFSLSNLSTKKYYNLKIFKKFSNDLRKLTKRKLDFYDFRKRVILNHNIKLRLKELYEIKRDKVSNLNIYDYYLIVYSYYLSNYDYLFLDLVNEILSQIEVRNEKVIKTALTGSTLYLPNKKVMSIITDLGSDVSVIDNELNITHAYVEYRIKPLNKMDDIYMYLVENYLINTEKLYEVNHKVCGIENYDQQDGVVYVCLKGQVNYDFNFSKFESMCNKPLIKLETDYFNEDVEQIRIRLEAFNEMLLQY